MIVKTIVCDTCKTNTFKLDGGGSLRREARKAGWSIRKGTHACPTCRKAAEASKKASGKPATKKASGKGSKKGPVVRVGNKVVRQSAASKKPATPFTAGTSIGKLARSAKVDAAPSAE